MKTLNRGGISSNGAFLKGDLTDGEKNGHKTKNGYQYASN